MKGDFSRDTFDPKDAFYRVMLQQGRVQLDADWNEQIAILLRTLETVVADIFGPHGGPLGYSGFAVVPHNDPESLLVSRGRYYVEGILCENLDRTATVPLPTQTSQAPAFLYYLDVYEEYVAAVQQASIADVALGGFDTAGRSRIRWTVKCHHLHQKPPNEQEAHAQWLRNAWQSALQTLSDPRERGRLRARACSQTGYSGSGNQLYRVEIHDAGTVDSPERAATWKWSRENASVAFTVTGISGGSISLAVGPGMAGAISVDDWVEITNDGDREDTHKKRPLMLVKEVAGNGASLTVAPDPEGDVFAQGCVLRRWDQRVDADGADLTERGGCLAVTEGTWLHLESGVDVLFASPTGNEPPRKYRGGDYWLIPARTATTSIDWPQASDDEAGLAPHGVKHSYAPLTGYTVVDNGALSDPVELRVLRHHLSREERGR